MSWQWVHGERKCFLSVTLWDLTWVQICGWDVEKLYVYWLSYWLCSVSKGEVSSCDRQQECAGAGWRQGLRSLKIMNCSFREFTVDLWNLTGPGDVAVRVNRLDAVWTGSLPHLQTWTFPSKLLLSPESWWLTVNPDRALVKYSRFSFTSSDQRHLLLPRLVKKMMFITWTTQ